MDTARTLSANLADLLRCERDALAEFLVALAVFDERRLWADMGYASLFYYLHRELGLSKGAAQYRKVAAEFIQKIPGLVEPLRDGRVCLTSIIEAAKVVTPENWEVVLPRFYGRSKREAMEVVAALLPHPAPPARTVLTAPRPAAARDPAPTPLLEVGPAAASTRDESRSGPGWPDELPPPAPAARRPAELVPLTAEQGRLHVTVTTHFAKKLEQAKAARPGESVEALLEAGLDLLLSQAAKRKGLVENRRRSSGRRSRSTSRSRSTGGVEARRRPVPMEAPQRRAVRLHAGSSVRPHRAAGARRDLDRRQRPAALPRSQ
jgi:hypothetical protein